MPPIVDFTTETTREKEWDNIGMGDGPSEEPAVRLGIWLFNGVAAYLANFRHEAVFGYFMTYCYQYRLYLVYLLITPTALGASCEIYKIMFRGNFLLKIFN